MASNRKRGEDGCLGAVIALLIVLALVFAGITVVGHLLGLTPSLSEVTDRPEGWVGRHYEGVVVGYVLTVLFLGVVAVAIWLAIRTQSEVAQQADKARYWLSRVASVGIALLLAIIFLPVGKRDEVEGNVPRLVGMSAAEAEAALDKESLEASFRETPSDDERCKVVKQDPPPAAEVEEYGEVKLRCAVRVPTVVDRKAEAARSRLFDLGLQARFVNAPVDLDLSRCRVIRQSRSGEAPPDSEIALRLRCRRPPPPPEPEPVPEERPPEEPVPAETCDPNYAPCVPPYPPDVDCDDIGNSVTVLGEDPHGLDTDDPDRVGCEP